METGALGAPGNSQKRFDQFTVSGAVLVNVVVPE